METRFIMLSLLTFVFQIVCAITLVIGIGIIIAGTNPSPANPFSQVPAIMKIGGGAVLALYGLTGLVFSGGINVLISIDQNTHSLSKTLPATLAALQKVIAANPTLIATSAPSPQPAASTVSAAIHSQQKQCPTCNSLNDANGRFCEYCGEPLGQTE